MNQYLKNLNKIEFIVTYACTGRCKHCSEGDHASCGEPERLGLIDAIRFLRSIKALPILAHPLKDISAEQLCEMLPRLIEAGLVGIETMHSSYSDEEIAISKEIAHRYSLLQSGGSDYHGTAKPDVSLGIGKGNLDVQDTVYYDLLRLRESLYRKLP